MPSPYSRWQTALWPKYFLFPGRPGRPAERGLARKATLSSVPALETMRLVLLGDWMVSQGDRIPEFTDQLNQIVRRGDLVIGNCEAPVSRRPCQPNAHYVSRFDMPVDYLRGVLDALGLDPRRLALSLANNHVTDHAAPGVMETLEIFAELGIRPLGLRRGGAPGVDVIEMTSFQLVIYAWTQWMNNTALGDGFERVNWQPSHAEVQPPAIPPTERARFSIGFPHWGYEFRHVPEPATVALARALIRERAFDVIVGGHAHSVQGGELIARDAQSSALVLYSLGNFVFTHAPYVRWGRAWPLGIVPVASLEVGLDAGGRAFLRRYEIEFFYQQTTGASNRVVTLAELPAALQRKATRLVDTLFPGPP
jgi:poly-gamma-glutamate synthesis protein (capsule biosynthesis protein)